MKPKRKTTWLKNRGYLHITRQINADLERGEILGKVKSPSFVAKHAFFPLIHTNIKVRRYKFGEEAKKRSHSYKGQTHAKLRPLHYATHIDSMIFGYYGEQLQTMYLKELDRVEHLSKCVTAYRRIADPGKKGSHKSTIHFANEVFQEIKDRAQQGCWVLKFDIEKFFSSMDHRLLKEAWSKLIGSLTLPEDHYSVFKAATKFSYILKDDLRTRSNQNGHRSNFDEKELAYIRKGNVSAFFDDPSSFRHAVRSGRFKIYKNGYRNANGEMIGIPQGLPISATLANLYLLRFDQAVVDEIVVKCNGYYRRYSDDIIVICNESNKDAIIDFIDSTLRNNNKVKISKEKTEQHYFGPVKQGEKEIIMSHLLEGDKLLINRPLTYLGFEFYGYKVLIKSSNLSKFYRRMILAVKSRSKRAVLSANKNPGAYIALFRRRLYRLYTNINLDKKSTTRKHKFLVPNRFGFYVYQTEENSHEFRSNYFTYGRRAADIMNEPGIVKQVRRHRTIFNQAIKKHLALSKEKLLQ